MAVLYTAYLDDSGTHRDSQVVAVAGFVTDVVAWERFSEEWGDALDQAGIESFHMADFENRQGPFKEWAEDERRENLNRFLTIIKKHTVDGSSVGWAVPKKNFDSIFSEKAKKICGDAYGLAAIGCFRSIGKVAADPRLDGWVEFVIESGTQGRDALQWIHREGRKDPEWMDNNRIISLAFRDKRLYLPLQAADILAYELYKKLQVQLGLTQYRSDRYPLLQLVSPARQWHYPDDDELRSINEWLSKPH